MAAIARVYNQSFDRNPYATLAVTNSGLNVLGDVIAQGAQMMTAKDGEVVRYDPMRSMRFAAFGLAMGPFIGRWIKFLEHQFPMPKTNSSRANLLALTKRVASDQAVMAPAGLLVFLGSMGVMEGRSREEIMTKYRDLYMPALFMNWKVWPAVQFVNFKFIPLPFRVPFQSSCGCFWTLYLSLLNASDNKAHPKHDKN
ncbi:hypothetical protein BKA62DRAFT_477504 [Auriculariales sp. MPI-PUGE-AT-0066]|nr:hypothetical protein BKA62DRAFT_477504 [Auriculariales sp. MPI-PUGE-AT-0066]